MYVLGPLGRTHWNAFLLWWRHEYCFGIWRENLGRSSGCAFGASTYVHLSFSTSLVHSCIVRGGDTVQSDHFEAGPGVFSSEVKRLNLRNRDVKHIYTVPTCPLVHSSHTLSWKMAKIVRGFGRCSLVTILVGFISAAGHRPMTPAKWQYCFGVHNLLHVALTQRRILIVSHCSRDMR